MSLLSKSSFATAWSNAAGNFLTNGIRAITAAIMRQFATDIPDSFLGYVDDYLYYLKTTTASGTDTYTITDTIPAAYTSGERFLVTFTNANTGAATLNRNGGGAKDLKTVSGAALTAGQIVAGGSYIVRYNGTEYRILNLGVGGGAISGLTANRIPYAASATSLADDADLTWSTANNQLKIGADSSIFGGAATRVHAVRASSAGSGSALSGIFESQQTAASTGGPQGVEGYAYTSNASGSVVLSIANIGNIEHAGAGTLSFGRGVQAGGILSSAGTISNMTGLFSTFAITGGGTITDYYGAYLETPSAGGGTITNRWGLYSQDPNAVNYFGGNINLIGKLGLNGSYGTAGYVLTSQGSGSAPTWESNILQNGTYTPTLANVNNTSSHTAFACQYMRVGSVVHVAGMMTFSVTAAVATDVSITLPIASNFGAAEDCAGTGFSDGKDQGCIVYGDSGSNLAYLHFVAKGTGSHDFRFMFTYEII